MNTYYLYINREDLNRFLLENLIFPHNESFNGRRTLSLMLDNVLIFSRKKYNNDIIEKLCNDGMISATVLEVEIPKEVSKKVYENDEFLIINDIISFSNVKRIFNVFEEVPNFIYNDIFLFNSLINDSLFSDNNDSLDLEFIKNIQLNMIDDLTCKLKHFSKIQAFYCARFGFLLNENISKKKVVFRRNIDLDSFKYISNLSYDKFVDKYYEKNKKANKQVSSSDGETTYLNDNFENILSDVLHDTNINNNPYKELYEMLINFQSDNILEILSSKETFKNALKIISSLEWNQVNNISFLKQYFNEINDDRITITIFILSRILEMDIGQARLYINNFFDKSEFEKELLSMYGLAKGMKAISITIKQKPDILLFAFNKTKKYFKDFVDTISDYNKYYAIRDYIPSCILCDGFDLKIYDEKAEYDYINKKLYYMIIEKYGLDEKTVAKKIIKNLKPKELHDLFLKLKEGR
jgi:hypothetical protein